MSAGLLLTQNTMNIYESRLRSILDVVNQYLPPGGTDAKTAMGQIIALVDPWSTESSLNLPVAQNEIEREVNKPRHMIPGLRHEHMGLKDEEFFSHIDANGGWPLGYRYVGFVHSDEREAGFCNSPVNDGWWTVVACADDYHLWKLSPEALQRIVDATVSAIRLPRMDAQKLHIKSWRGWRAALSSTSHGQGSASEQKGGV